MSHSYLHNPVHVVFSTKERRKLISNESRSHLWAYLAGVCKKQKIFVHEIGGMEDHLHVLIQIPLTLAYSDAMQEIKSSSSRWMGRNFSWQRGFGIFGVSASNVDAVMRYIRTQEVHHRKMTFEQEFIALLKKHGVHYDPRYVFG
ncbi:MAG TPA: IS200/IS605 family transposase [Candidatus Angelobacter sp.]|nr:IS200/IS605 family transposase [Candidatus Angelobacter sp.]